MRAKCEVEGAGHSPLVLDGGRHLEVQMNAMRWTGGPRSGEKENDALQNLGGGSDTGGKTNDGC